MEFRVLGPLEVIDGQGRIVPVNGTRLRRLLAVLVLRANETVSTDQLADALWGDQPGTGSTNAIQVQVSKLRRALSTDSEPLPLRTTASGYRLEVAPAATDIGRFEELLARGRQQAAEGRPAEARALLATALELWRGEVLADFAFDEFAQPARLRLAEDRLVCLEERIEADLAVGQNSGRLVPELEALAAEHPLRERVCGQLMTALYQTGRQADALRAFQRIRAALVDELGIEPGPELAELERRVLNQDPTLLAQPAPAPRAPGPGLTGPGLPAALSACVGRTEDVEVVRTELARRRLVTVTGPGGVGKTRLAIEVASAGDHGPAGVWLVELDAAEGPSATDDALTRTFARWLGPGPGGSRPPGSVVDQIGAAVGASELLLVVDNCEHVVTQAATAVAALLRACPGLTVLATSREPLDLPGEVVHQLHPLAGPAAVELFVARAAEASTRFVADDATLAAIREICDGVDRLPLAIELAAARTRAFTVHQLADRIHRRFGLPAARSTQRPARHVTLHAAVEWSYDLLFEDEQLLLDRLSVFAGGFTLDAAEAVCADHRLPVTDVAEILARLVDKSLVVHDPSGRGLARSRYRLLQAVADFAAGHLDQRGETTTFRDRQVHWLVDLTSGARPGLRGADQQTWLQILSDEEPNLGRAARWSFQGGDPGQALQIVANLDWYVFITARLTSYHDMGLRVLAAVPDGFPQARARVKAYCALLGLQPQASEPGSGLTGRASLAAEAVHEARALDDPELVAELVVLAAMPLALTPEGCEQAGDLIDEARAAVSGGGDEWLQCLVGGIDGVRRYVAGDPSGGAVALAQVSGRLRQLGDRLTAAQIDNRRSEAAELAGDITGAIEAIEAVLNEGGDHRSPMKLVATARRAWFAFRQGDHQLALSLASASEVSGNQPFQQLLEAAWSLVRGAASGRLGHVELAQAHLERAIAFYQRSGMSREAALATSELGRTETIAGHLDQALASHRDAVAHALDCRLPAIAVYCLDGLAHAQCAVGQHHAAAQTLAATEALLARTGAAVTEAEQGDRAAVRAAVAAALGPGDPVDAASAGPELDYDQLRALAGLPDPAN